MITITTLSEYLALEASLQSTMKVTLAAETTPKIDEALTLFYVLTLAPEIVVQPLDYIPVGIVQTVYFFSANGEPIVAGVKHLVWGTNNKFSLAIPTAESICFHGSRQETAKQYAEAQYRLFVEDINTMTDWEPR